MSGRSEDSPSARLRREFIDASKGPRIGGASVLKNLSALACKCVTGSSPAQDSVAFTLCTIFGLHADDRDERPVTGDDTYLLMASGSDHLTDAVEFLVSGEGGPGEAIRIIAALAQLTPKNLYRH